LIKEGEIMKKWLLIFALAVCMLPAVMPVRVQQSSMHAPWTYQAQTFNPAGVRYAGGVTTGNEIAQRKAVELPADKLAEILKGQE